MREFVVSSVVLPSTTDEYLAVVLWVLLAVQSQSEIDIRYVLIYNGGHTLMQSSCPG